MTVASDAAMTALVAGWHPARRDQSLTKRYNVAARAWHGKVQKLGYIDAYSSLIANGERLLAASLCQESLSVLDAGTGTGAFTLALVRWLSRVSPRANVSIDLLDPSQAMLSEAINNLASAGYRVRGLCQYIRSLPEQIRTYDVVLCGHVIEHSTNPERELSILKSVLKPSGVLFLTMTKPSWLTRLLQLRWQHGAFDELSATQLLCAAGFQCIESFSFAKGPPMLTSRGFIAVAPCDAPSRVGHGLRSQTHGAYIYD